MPLYEYRCGTCGSVFEVRQKFADEPLTVHENCGGPVKRLLSAPALQFKGTGWYITDYAKGNGGSSAPGKSQSGESKSEGKSETKSESKSADTSSSSSSSPPSTSSTDSKK